MMNYEDMTDFEINKAVLEIELCGQFGWTIEQEKCELYEIMGIESDVVKLTTESGSIQRFDPCNDPSHAWPIIVENKINTIWQRGKLLAFSDEVFDGVPHDCEHENPLRAAMIVFLMMQEQSK